MSVYVYGANPLGTSPSSKNLLKELVNAGFKPREIKHANSHDDIPDNSYVICFGAPAVKALTGMEDPMRDLHGTLCSMQDRTHVLVFPTYSPGYLFHNPHKTEEWRRELELFYAAIKTDQGVFV